MKQSINVLKTKSVSDPVTNKEAVRMIKNYKDNLGHINGKTKSVWFSLQTLKDLVAYVDSINTEQKKGSGVRVYIGRYENHADYPQKYRNKRTLVLVPTYDLNGTSDNHIDDISVEEVQKIKKDLENGTYLEDLSPYNHGELCPDDCNGTNIITGLE